MSRCKQLLLVAGALMLAACHAAPDADQDGKARDPADQDQTFQQVKDAPTRFRIGSPFTWEGQRQERWQELRRETGNEALDAQLQALAERENDARAQARFEAAVSMYKAGHIEAATALFDEAVQLRVQWTPERVRLDAFDPASQPPQGAEKIAQFWDLNALMPGNAMDGDWPHEGEAHGVAYALAATPVGTRELVKAVADASESDALQLEVISHGGSLLAIGNKASLQHFDTLVENLVNASEAKAGSAYSVTATLYGLDALPKASASDSAARDLDQDGDWDFGRLHVGVDREAFTQALRAGGELDPEVLTSPRFTAYGWQSAVMEVSNQVGFVSGVDVLRTPEDRYLGDPHVDYVRHGMSLAMRIAPLEGERLALAFRLESVELKRPMREEQVQLGDSTFQFQVPELSRWEMASSGVLTESQHAVVLMPVDPQSSAKGFVAVELVVERTQLHDPEEEKDQAEVY